YAERVEVSGPLSFRTRRASDLLQPYECRKVLIEGVTIRNSPFWVIHPVLCESVTVRRVTVDSHGPNSDGCDPESCDHVLIEDCVDRKSTRLNSSHVKISYAVFC